MHDRPIENGFVKFLISVHCKFTVSKVRFASTIAIGTAPAATNIPTSKDNSRSGMTVIKLVVEE
jgi:hypothetical protein